MNNINLQKQIHYRHHTYNHKKFTFVMLVKNQLLEEIVAQLATTKITDDILIKEFKKNGRAVTQVESFHGILG